MTTDTTDVARAMTLRLLDLFCGQGGAAMGYHRAGFDVTGVDKDPQPRYPFTFVQADALDYLREHGHRYDAIHASPPCQRYTTGGRVSNREKRPDLIGPVRELLLAKIGKPWVIENVPGAPMRPDVTLCGSMFGLKLRRHRFFESSVPMPLAPPCAHNGPIVGVYGHPHGKAGAWPGMLPSTLETWSEAMGIDWMDASGLAEAIPPAYTELIGRAVAAYLQEQGR
jgi:DNA (cytosine-5)-methyltransferase 1